MEKFGIYVHIPFCKRKCYYCDFISYDSKIEEQERYINSLLKEIEEKKVDFNRKVTSIYIGGGTPSFIDSKWISQILNKIREKFILDDNIEITIEINPGTINESKLLEYKQSGINRISIGLQTTKNYILKKIGRIHSYEEFLEGYELVKKVGFENTNIDLMLGLPEQTQKDMVDSLIKVINLNPKHISLYSLILEENTVLQKMVLENKVSLPDDDAERKMYWKTKKILEKNGYIQYEISNFAKKGFESNHNLDCWNQEEYVGYGLASHSYIDKKRFSNTSCLEEYIKNIEENNINKNITINEIQDKSAQCKEYMMLGLRKIDGVSISKFERKFKINPLFYFRFELDKLVNDGLLEIDLDRIKATNKGLDFANIIFEEFI